MNKFEQASNDGHQMLLAARDQGPLYSKVPYLDEEGTREGGARGLQSEVLCQDLYLMTLMTRHFVINVTGSINCR